MITIVDRDYNDDFIGDHDDGDDDNHDDDDDEGEEEEEDTSKSMSIRLQPQEWFLENKITWVTMLAVLAAVQVRQINVIS